MRGGKLTPEQLSTLPRWTKRWVHYISVGPVLIVWSGKAVEAPPEPMSFSELMDDTTESEGN